MTLSYGAPYVFYVLKTFSGRFIWVITIFVWVLRTSLIRYENYRKTYSRRFMDVIRLLDDVLVGCPARF